MFDFEFVRPLRLAACELAAVVSAAAAAKCYWLLSLLFYEFIVFIVTQVNESDNKRKCNGCFVALLLVLLTSMTLQ